jgi:biopolymer transport protein ExbB/TolQ
MWGELAHSIQHGNIYVMLVLVLSFFSLIVIFERLIMLQFVFHIDFSKFLANIRKMIAAEDMDRAINLCKSVSSTSLPKITLRALEAAEADPTTIRGTLEEETIEFLPKLERRINLLPALATLIMLVGILGTIDGLWNAFHSIDVLDTAKKQASLAQGIAGSLNPSALGLIVCMFILAGHQVLRGIAVTLTERVHYGVTVLTNLLVPQEVAHFMPIAAPEPAMAQADVSTDTKRDAAPKEQETQEDSFDDASVEDIKDEEEII